MIRSGAKVAGKTAVLLFVAALLLALAPGESRAVGLEAGMAAPDFTVQTLRGDTVSLHDYDGKVVLVMFWSSWCSRCREEAEFLRAMQEKYPALELLALNAETDRPTAEDVARIEEAVKTRKLPLAVAIDEGLQVWNRYQVNALPTSMIVGADGIILFIEANFYWASPEKIDDALRSAFSAQTGGTVPGTHLDRDDEPFDEAEIMAGSCHRELCLVADLPRQ